MLGGKPTRRGGQLTRALATERSTAPPRSAQLLVVITVVCLIFGIVAGFTWAMDRQLRAGLLEQRAEAMQRPDWVPLVQLPPHVPQAFIAAVDPTFDLSGTTRGR